MTHTPACPGVVFGPMCCAGCENKHNEVEVMKKNLARYLELRRWMRERCITLTAVGQQLGWGKTKNPASYVIPTLQRESMDTEKRDHLLALGFPENLLPVGGYTRKKMVPQWPNPEAAKTPYVPQRAEDA